MSLIYATGRDLAVHMSFKLQEYNDARSYPTLKKYVDSFDNGWLYETSLLKERLEKGKDKYKELGSSNWAIERMIQLFDEQIGLLGEIRRVIDSLRKSEIYQWENGSFQQGYTSSPSQDIIRSIVTIGKGLERNPSTYFDKDEESLRDYILVALQTSTSDSVTGETFNKKGKTDLLVRGGDNNVFIGELKFWHGKVSYLEAITQLLSYLSWRDNNVALIIFVQNQDFSNVLSQITVISSQHNNYVRLLSQNESFFEFEFHINGDNNRLINLSVLLFHLP